MTPALVPFPLARRRDLIARQAAWYTEQSHKAAERNLHHQLQVQRDALLRRGVSTCVVEAEVAALHAAIRAEVWRLTHSRGGEA